MKQLADILDARTRSGTLLKKDGDAVQCLACAHRCRIQPGKRGLCQMRFNQDGEFFVPWGYVAAANVDPIEKKPFMHFLPSQNALTFGMLGCNFHCDFCQNWVSSQALRDPAANGSSRYIQDISAKELVEYGLRQDAKIIASSYNEPLITTEWAIEIFKEAKKNNLKCVYVSNGFATPEALDALSPYLDGFKIDLKCFSDDHYRTLGGRLEAVQETIRGAHTRGMWVEVVTLVIPEFNDSNEELWESARFINTVSSDIPWHVTSYYPTYKHTGSGRTPAESIQRAAEIGQEAGLRYVYAGNLPGQVGSLENTYCPSCQTLLIERYGFTVKNNAITPQGTCPRCGTPIAGVWK